MKLLIKLSAFLMCLTFLGFSQIDNVQFTETRSEVEYDLYTLLAEGKHLLVHAGGYN
jgi:hypothetical protein